jgi:NADH-quinone oxidoreductase subunit L
MMIPIILLSVGSIASGYLLSTGKNLVNWLEPVLNPMKEHHSEELFSHTTVTIMTLSAVVVGVAIALRKYRGDQLKNAPEKVSKLTLAARKDLYQDSFNEATFMRPGQSLISKLLKLDHNIIDGAVRSVGAIANSSASKLRSLQSGYVRSYALMMVIGVLVLVGVVWIVTA